MDFHFEKYPQGIVVQIPAEVIDAKSAKAFRSGISEIIDKNLKVVFDMSRVEFMDSSGCGAILSCLRRLHQKGGDLKMFGLQPKVRTLIELIRMHRIIEIFDTQQEALQSF